MNSSTLFLILSLILGGLISSTVRAQSDSLDIRLPQKVKTLIERKKAINKQQFETQYYALQLYYGNYTAAKRLLQGFEEKYPTWETELVFETPNYKVRVGRFKNLKIANQKLEKIRQEYPSAFLLEPNNL